MKSCATHKDTPHVKRSHDKNVGHKFCINFILELNLNTRLERMQVGSTSRTVEAIKTTTTCILSQVQVEINFLKEM